MKTPTPSKAAEKSKGEREIWNNNTLINTTGRKKRGEKKEHKACGSIKSKWQIPTHQYH